MIVTNLPMVISPRHVWNKSLIVGLKRPVLPKRYWAFGVGLKTLVKKGPGYE